MHNWLKPCGVRNLHIACLAILAATTFAPAQHASGVGTWATAPVPANAPPGAGTTDETLRQIVHVSLGAGQLIVTFTNEFGTEPLTIAAATVSIRTTADRTTTPVTLYFRQKPTTTIPAGATDRTDLAALKFPAGADLAITLYLPAQTIGRLTRHDFANTTNYSAPGNQTTATHLTGASEITSWRYLKSVEVPEVDNRGVGTIVCLGASITDGAHSTKDANHRWPDVLARRLQANRTTQAMGVLNEGIGGNRILHDGTGPSALARFDRDVLRHSSVLDVIVMEGTNDIGNATDPKHPHDIITAQDLIAGYQQLATRAHAHGIKIFIGTIPPFTGAAYSSPAGETMRQTVNQWIRTTHSTDGSIDFDRATRDPADPTRLLPAYDSGDHLHPNDAGYQAMGEAIDLTLFTK